MMNSVKTKILRRAAPIGLYLLAATSAHALVEDRPSFKVEGVVVVWAADPSSNAPVAGEFILDTGIGSTAAGSGDIDLIATQTHSVVTGTLSPTQDAFSGATGGIPFVLSRTGAGTVQTDTNGDGIVSDQDAFGAFELDRRTDIGVTGARQSSSFYVASNVPFAIDAEAFTPSNFTELILLVLTRVTLSVTVSGDDGISFGGSAQPPHSGGTTSGVAAGLRLWDLRNPRNVFTGDQRTAARPGSIADQSVRFDAEYALSGAGVGGYDLSLGTFDFEVEVVYTVFVP